VNTLFFRLLSHEDKAAALSEAVAAVSEGRSLNPVAHAVDPASFRQVPGSPFAYWVSERIRRLFTILPSFEGEGRTVKQGLATADDFRFVRAWWEVPPERILDGANGPDWCKDLPAFQAWCRQRTFAGKRWVPFAKGGAYSPYYTDLHLVVDWERDGEEIRNFVDPISKRPYSRPQNTDFYFCPGLTWPLRTQLDFNMRAYPAGATFGHKGPVAFVGEGELLPYLGLSNSDAFGVLISLQMAFGSYEVGVVQRTPVPDGTDLGGKQLGELAQSAIALKQFLDTSDETSHVFRLPALLQVPGSTLAERIELWSGSVAAAEERLAKLQQQIDVLASQFYGIAEEYQPAMPVSLDGAVTTADGEEDEETPAEEKASTADSRNLITDLLSYALGTALGRWDIHYAAKQRSYPALPDPFAPLPVCSPGMLTGEDGLPSHEALPDYPLGIDQDGIVVDDSDHPDDIVRRVREVLELIFERAEGSGQKAGQAETARCPLPTADSIEREACEILGVKELREYFRKPGKGGFWDDHVKRYSKSRRKAPLYWLLQSSKKNYALWLYYHRLDKDLLFKALLHYVEPKLALVQSHLSFVRSQVQQARDQGQGTRDIRKLEKEIEKQEAFLTELRDFESKLRRAANLHLEPDLNDGVILNIAPLWELVPWKEAKQYWDELLDGKYEWSSIGKQL
jgi:hypothetical protein